MINQMMYDDFKKYENVMIKFITSINATLVQSSERDFIFRVDGQDYKIIKDKNGRIYFKKGAIKYFKMMLREYDQEMLVNLFPNSYKSNTKGKMRYDDFLEYQSEFIKYLKANNAKDIKIDVNSFSFKIKDKDHQCFKDKSGDVYFRKGAYDYFNKMINKE